MDQQIYDHQTAMQSTRKQYPYNLLRSVAGEPFDTVCLTGLEKAMQTLLPREEECLVMRFAHNMTLSAIGDQYGLSRERARQIIVKGLRKLAHPSRMCILRAVPSEQYRDLAEQHRTLQAEYNALLAEYSVLQAEHCIQPVKEPPSLRGTTLEDADISVRSYNCLKRVGINTLGDVADMTGEDLMRVRNLGRKSADEVIAVLKKFGLRLTPMEGDAYA